MKTIKVTEEHIKNGVISTTNNCAIALALFEAGYRDICVQLKKIQYMVADRCYSQDTPEICQNFIKKFDSEEEVEPIEFEIEFPEPVLLDIQEEKDSEQLQSLLGQSC